MTEPEKEYYGPPPPRKQIAFFLRAVSLFLGVVLLGDAWWNGMRALISSSGSTEVVTRLVIGNAIMAVGKAISGAVLFTGAVISYTLAEK